MICMYRDDVSTTEDHDARVGLDNDNMMMMGSGRRIESCILSFKIYNITQLNRN